MHALCIFNNAGKWAFRNTLRNTGRGEQGLGRPDGCHEKAQDEQDRVLAARWFPSGQRHYGKEHQAQIKKHCMDRGLALRREYSDHPLSIKISPPRNSV